jgi:predicted nucleic acid-binding protein
VEQIANPEHLEFDGRPGAQRPLVFLDTKVIIGYLSGDPSAAKLFSAEAADRIRFAANPIVLQELLLADAAALPEFDQIRDHLRVLPVDLAEAEALPAGNRTAHPNEILILSSADQCDYLVTRDSVFKIMVIAEKPQVVTPEYSSIS